MTLDSLQLLCLQAADGELDAEGRAALLAAGEDPEAWSDLPSLVRDTLRVDDLPELADKVLAALGLVDEIPAIQSALAVEGSPELADAVLGALGLDTGDQALRAALREGGEAGPDLATDVLQALGLAAEGPLLGELLRTGLPEEEPDLADAVMVAIGAADQATPLGELLSTGAGQSPELWSGVAEALGLATEEAADSDATDEAPMAAVVPLRPARRWSQLGAIGVAMAAAAALLLVVKGSPQGSSPTEMAFRLAPVNSVQFEDMYSEAAMVQVIEQDDGGPTIIYIYEPPDEDAGEAGGARL